LGRTSDQLLRLFVLNALVTMSSRADFQYVDGVKLRDSLNRLGYGNDTIMRVLNDLCRLRFAHTAGHGPATFEAEYYPSRLGGYVVRYLIADLTFLEAMLMDTFIADASTWESLRSLSEQVDSQRGDLVRRLELRHRRIDEFYGYTHKLYTQIAEEAGRRSLSNEWLGDPFAQMAGHLDRNKRQAMDSAKKHYG
jgi:hypothetical protein